MVRPLPAAGAWQLVRVGMGFIIDGRGNSGMLARFEKPMNSTVLTIQFTAEEEAQILADAIAVAVDCLLADALLTRQEAAKFLGGRSPP